ncbi:tetratricopeptide repeat protein [Streptomyces sp. NPDC005209]|uniref:tetratricopeptide repeat protein n=1 Tax=Streptomyces sp. NPDC005209 TaxID=3156715 RepID=UPI0033A455A3
MGGIGKTALAIEAAHQACSRGWFPGGPLFVDLRGYDDNPVTAEQAVLALLDALGIRGPNLPSTTARQYDVYRDRLAQRQDRTLLILDNVSDPSQFLPLLPEGGHHAVLITSRDRPDSLAIRLMGLEPLDKDDSAALVAGALRSADEHDDRPVREPAALRELIALCGYLPLALQIAAAMLRRRRHRDIASLVSEIKNSDDPTRMFDSGGRGTDQYGRSLVLRPVLETSYRRLEPEQARVLRILALAPGADTDTEAAAALTHLNPDIAMTLLEDLAAASLVTAVAEKDAVRWRVHDLVRAFGAGVVAADDGLRKEGEAARTRVLAHYHACAAAADDRLRWLPGRPEPKRFADRAQALAWLDAERTALVAAVQWAREEKYACTAVGLAQSLSTYLDWRRYFEDWITVSRAAQEAACRAGDQVSEAIAWDSLGNPYRAVDRIDDAIDAHTRARDLFHTAEERHREAIAWNNLGNALQSAGRTTEAIDALAHARDLYDAVEDRHGEAMSWNNLGIALRTAGREDEAIGAHTRARDLYQGAADHNGEGIAWNNLAIALERAGRATEAMEAYGSAIGILKEFEDWFRAGHALRNLALAHEEVHRVDEARTAYLQAAEAFTQANAPDEARNAEYRAGTLT